MSKSWTADELLKLASGYQAASVVQAAADLDLFAALAGRPCTAQEIAKKLSADPRGVTILLDALCALQLLDKQGETYHLPAPVAELLTGGGKGNVLAMMRHQGTCLRRWAQLARVVQSGRPAERVPSIRGADADYAAFVEAMDNISGPAAPRVVADIRVGPYKHLLDVGGASGTWTIAFLRSNLSATATILDLPEVIPQAQERIAAAGLAGRVKLVAGDFYIDDLPGGADLAWVSAIVHQNSRQQNRDLFAKVRRALVNGGRILIRDMLMDSSRTSPAPGAMFAVNMLCATEQGGTFTFDELREDLESSGLVDCSVLRKEEGMNCVVQARRP